MEVINCIKLQEFDVLFCDTKLGGWQVQDQLCIPVGCM